tara:strand:- start:840 stop:1550 length:711 start_codon:yes stop_codon:yes gene_type:complete
MATQEELNELRNKIVQQIDSASGPGVMSNKEAATTMSALSSNETQPMPSGMKQDNAEIIAVLTEAIAKETNPEAKAELRKKLQLYQMTQKLKDQMQQQPAPQQTMFKPNSIEENIAAIQANMDRETQISPERKAFIDGRQELINEVLMPLSNAGYKELVDIILTKPKDSAEHNQASIELARIAAQMDDEFNPDEFDMMLNMVSKEPRPADLINPEGLPDKNAETIRQEQQGIGALE